MWDWEACVRSCMFKYVWAHTETGNCWHRISLAFSTLFFLKDGLSLNLDYIHSAMLASQYSQESSCLCLPSTGITGVIPRLTFYMVLRINSGLHAREASCSLVWSHLSRRMKSFIDLKCVCMCIWWHADVFPGSRPPWSHLIWVLGTQLRSSARTVQAKPPLGQKSLILRWCWSSMFSRTWQWPQGTTDCICHFWSVPKIVGIDER